jgi:hypothetical protein
MNCTTQPKRFHPISIVIQPKKSKKEESRPIYVTPTKSMAEEESSISAVDVPPEEEDSPTPMLTVRGRGKSKATSPPRPKQKRAPAAKGIKRDRTQKTIEESFKPLDENSEPKLLRIGADATSSTPVKSNSKGRKAAAPISQSPLSPRWQKVRKQILSPTFRKTVAEESVKVFDKSTDICPNQVVRNRALRAKMTGQECPCCAPYYDALDLSPGERQRRINQVSRHRSFADIPRTPERYWDIDFPSVEEQKRLGLLVETDSPLIKQPMARRKLIG